MISNKEIDDELWDYYSGLPNPMWYQRMSEIKDEEENTSGNNDTEVITG